MRKSLKFAAFAALGLGLVATGALAADVKIGIQRIHVHAGVVAVVLDAHGQFPLAAGQCPQLLDAGGGGLQLGAHVASCERSNCH